MLHCLCAKTDHVGSSGQSVVLLSSSCSACCRLQHLWHTTTSDLAWLRTFPVNPSRSCLVIVMLGHVLILSKHHLHSSRSFILASLTTSPMQ